MVTRRTWLLAAVLLIAGCARQANPPVEASLVVAVHPSVVVPAPALEGARVIRTERPLEALQSGEAAVAVTSGAVAAPYVSRVLQTDEKILLQGWLDAPLSLSRAEAETRLAQAPPAAGVEPGPGKVVRGRLTDMRPGWRAIPVDGVVPTPETVSSSAYPLSGRVVAAHRPSPTPAVVSLLDRLGNGVVSVRPWATLTVAGDFMLSRGVARAMRENGTLYPIEKVKDHLAAADMTFTNLESPIGVKGTPLPGKQIWFRAPPEAMEILKAAGVDGVVLANNHILDYDTENFLETLDGLTAAGIRYTGGGRTIAEARKPMVLEAKGVRVAFVGYSQFADLFFDWGYPRSFVATDTLPGVPRIQEDWVAADIKAARAQADIVAVAYHWGDEFQNYPNEQQQWLARKTIDLGADLVLGFHPHAIQGFELYKGKFIAYSTGNFIMDRQDTDLARESMILDFAVSPEGVRSVTVHPVWIRAEQPYIMSGAEGERLLQKMRTLSGWK